MNRSLERLSSGLKVDRAQEPAESLEITKIKTGKQELNSGHKEAESSPFSGDKGHFDIENISTTQGRILNTNI